MTYKKFTILFLILFLIFLNDGMSHQAENGDGNVLHLSDGGIYGWTNSNDSSPNHDTASVSVSTSKSVIPMPATNGWSLFVSASVNITASAFKQTIVEKGVTKTIDVWPVGDHKMEAKIQKKNDSGDFECIKLGDNNIPDSLDHDAPVSKATYVVYAYPDSVKMNIDDYSAEGSGSVKNENTDPEHNADASASY